MTIIPKSDLKAAFQRQAELNPLADTEEVLELTATQFHCSPEDVAEAVESEEQSA